MTRDAREAMETKNYRKVREISDMNCLLRHTELILKKEEKIICSFS